MRATPFSTSEDDADVRPLVAAPREHQYHRLHGGAADRRHTDPLRRRRHGGRASSTAWGRSIPGGRTSSCPHPDQRAAIVPTDRPSVRRRRSASAPTSPTTTTARSTSTCSTTAPTRARPTGRCASAGPSRCQILRPRPTLAPGARIWVRDVSVPRQPALQSACCGRGKHRHACDDDGTRPVSASSSAIQPLLARFVLDGVSHDQPPRRIARQRFLAVRANAGAVHRSTP